MSSLPLLPLGRFQPVQGLEHLAQRLGRRRVPIRLTGRRQIGQYAPFDLILLLILTTVALGASPGLGGRAQELALAAAQVLHERRTTNFQRSRALIQSLVDTATALAATKISALVQALGWQPSDRLLHAMPLHHAHGLFMTTHCVLCVGASMLLAKRFEAGEVVAQLPQVTVFSGVPTMYHRMADVPGLLESGKGVRIFVSASAPLPADVLAKFEQRSGHRLVECWGMSETMTNTATPTDRARRPGTVGKPLPGVTITPVFSSRASTNSSEVA